MLNVYSAMSKEKVKTESSQRVKKNEKNAGDEYDN